MSRRTAMVLVHHRRVYKDAKCTWGKRLWIKGWTSDAISRISESDNANLAMESIFRAEVSKFTALPSSICCAVTAFEQWKGFFSFTYVHSLQCGISDASNASL